MTYEVTTEEQIWYLNVYHIEANSQEEAEELVNQGMGTMIDSNETEVHSFDIVNIEEI